jgi:hypothetical protein
MSEKFIKINESFKCLYCGLFNEKDKHGSCRNHCYYCLYSLHVDIYPGDRKESCNGLMKPIDIKTIGGKNIIYHKCLDCNKINKNKSLPDDNLINFYELY